MKLEAPIIDDSDILSEFFNETLSHLENAEVAILTLEKAPEDEETVNDLFRVFHSIKGSSGFLGMKEVCNFSHEVENLLVEVRDKKVSITAEIIDILFEGTDLLTRMIGVAMVNADLKPPKSLLAKTGKEITAEELTVHKEKIEQVLRLSKEEADKGEQEKRTESSFEKDKKMLGEILIEEGFVKQQDVEKALKVQKKISRTDRVHEDIRVDMEKINILLNAVGELVISYAVLNQTILQSELSMKNNNGAAGSRTEKDLSIHGKIVKQIQGQVMSIRMVQIKPTFQKMARLVRDIARKEKKEVEFKTTGEDTELDKTVIEEIGDPLVHILRNAIDHGIELPEERKKTNKPKKGSVSLGAYHKGGSVVIEIQDDGKGLDRDAIRKKAIEKGLVKEDDKMTDHEIYNLVFHPGLSTKKVVTDLSGRGVGMDVVKKNIEKLRGKVDVESIPGKGSFFSIKLPLTMAIIDGMLVKVGTEKYIIPTFSIIESIRPKRDDVTSVKKRMEVVNIRGRLFPLIRLHTLYNITPKHINPWDSMVMVVESNGSKGCILVDDLLGQQQVVIKSLDKRFNNVKSISGCAILGDGKVSLILDIDNLLETTVGSKEVNRVN